MSNVTYRVGIDIGGTFTDLVVVTSTGEMYIFKSPSTPADSSIGLFDCLKKAARFFELEFPDFMAKVDLLVHGTTVATNTMLQYNGAKTGLITTKGFRDALEMRRAHKENIWDLSLASPPPIIPRHLRLGVTERIDYSGNVITPLDETETRKVVNQLKAENVIAIAVCTLFSFMNPVHEMRIREIILEEYPECYVSISSEILPQIREYERSSTTAVNAYVGPVLGRYLFKLQKKLADAGLKREVLVTQSNGGIMSASYGVEHGASTLLSGPSAGAVGGMFFAKQLSLPNLIVMDMGGTSYDVTLIKDGNYSMTTEGEIARYRVALPMIDIHTIGAGGGSLAYLDQGNMLKVGPQSAGAVPGPACYGKGGTKPATTDINVILGYINPDFYLGGEFAIDKQASYDAVKQVIADPLNIDTINAAYGIYTVVNNNMADATRVVSVEKGHDPRDFSLVAAGGAGALHACKIAEIVGIPRVIVPKTASVFCAMGMLESDLKHDYVRTLWKPLDNIDFNEVNQAFDAMEAEARATLLAEGLNENQIQIERGFDLRYMGQHHEVPVTIPAGKIDETMLPEIKKRFNDAHNRLFLYSEPESPLESINIRLTGLGIIPKTSLTSWQSGGKDSSEAIKGIRKAYFGEMGGWVDTRIYDGSKLKAGNIIEGPAIIEEVTTTIVVNPYDKATIDRLGNVVIEINALKKF
ncbi:MAG TPA: hydantoinase/oxoprolinase family protein [Anaerolineaceae bacterium]|nr:hydantoinase/oxoprolinase family protein [Anaerolineaceae bacterium]